MVMENKTNFIIAVRGYTVVKKETKKNYTDVTAMDSLNKKVLLRVIEPINNECVNGEVVKDISEFAKIENYDHAILVSNKFTDNALHEMTKLKIQRVSDDYMPPFEIIELYSAIVNCANNQCNKKCGKTQSAISECDEKKVADICRIRALGKSAKSHFEDGLIGLLKNDLKTALALNK
jgi:hypothetical protein